MNASAPAFSPDKLRVLLFEDNAMDAALIKKFLQTAGVKPMHIWHADTIPSALQVLSRERVDLCLADYYLRPHTGFDLMDEVRRFDLDVPFIMLTALDDRGVDNGALERGAYNFMVKADLTVEGLERSIRYALCHHQRESSLAREALLDSLTGLPNRKAFFDRLTENITHSAARGGMIGMILININGTKFMNEAFGHKIGDEVLRGVADKLKTAKRPANIVARLGGDEFAVLVNDLLLPGDVVTAARALTDAISGLVQTSDGGHDVTVATGVAALTASRDKSAAETIAGRLMQQASHAMFAAKQNARSKGTSDLAVARMH